MYSFAAATPECSSPTVALIKSGSSGSWLFAKASDGLALSTMTVAFQPGA
jgi:hypothetical protein